MELNRTNALNFNGLKITDNAHETIKEIFLTELDKAETFYHTRLHNKHNKKQNYKKFHDEALYNICYGDAWNKLDHYDTVTLNYSLSSDKDMHIRKSNRGLVIETFVTDKDGNKIKTEHRNIKGQNDFFHYFKRKFFETTK